MSRNKVVLGLVIAGLSAVALWPSGCTSKECEDEARRIEARLAECGRGRDLSFACICSEAELRYAVCLTDCYESVSCDAIAKSTAGRTTLNDCVDACQPRPSEEFDASCLHLGDSGGGEGGAVGSTGGSDAAGGNGAAGGSSGGVGGSGGVSGGIAPYTVLSGEVTVESDGCVHAAGAPGGQLLLDASIAGAATLTVTGQFLPVPGGASAVSLLQVCAGGALNGAIVEGCHLGRADQSTTDDTGGIAIYDTGFTEVANDSWTPSGTMHDYELAVTSDPGAETMTVSLSIDGVPAASASAPNLGSPSGNRIVLTMLAVSVCSAVLQ